MNREAVDFVLLCLYMLLFTRVLSVAFPLLLLRVLARCLGLDPY